LSLVVLCDFDGTIAEIDTAEFTLSKFASEDWKTIDKQFEEGKMTLEECLRREFKLVTATKEEILDRLQNVVDFRLGFEELAEYCRNQHFPLIVVSAGLDFIIDHFLKLKVWRELVKTCTPKTKFTSNGIEFTFPRLLDTTSANFKQDLVRQYKSRDKKAAYIGDGSGDYDVTRESDYAFAIKNSRLARLCSENRVQCTFIDDFEEVTRKLRDEIVPSLPH
jgi:2-hydroxy-3-keto-5-methylthiopentenyl-1-phosphate phosphatase